MAELHQRLGHQELWAAFTGHFTVTGLETHVPNLIQGHRSNILLFIIIIIHGI